MTTTALGAVVGAVACTPSPLSPPHTGTPMNRPVAISSEPGSGSVEALRRQLAGRWDLVALEMVPAAGGPRVPVAATGTLTYDDYGNLTIDARTTDPAAPVAAREASRLSFEGRAVIDPAKSELKLMDLIGNVNPDEVLSPEWRRRFAFEGDTLRLSSFDEAGQVTAISTWRRP
jgi:hypothetical protein